MILVGDMVAIQLGKYLNLDDFCTCTNTYQKYASFIDPLPANPASLTAIKALNQFIIDPIIDRFGRDKFQLFYGFCSRDLKRYLDRKDPLTGIKNGRVDSTRDQHMACEVNQNGKYYCERLGSACDFSILNLESERAIEWILDRRLPFDSLYFYGSDRPIHISYGPQHKRDIWTFTTSGQPTKKGIESWVEAAKLLQPARIFQGSINRCRRFPALEGSIGIE